MASELEMLLLAQYSALLSNTIVGPAASTNYITGGANKTSGQQTFLYAQSGVVTVGSGSGWILATSGTTFHGVGLIAATPGDNSATLGFLTVIASNCSISSGTLTVNGAALQSGSTSGVGSGAVIRVNLLVIGW